MIEIPVPRTQKYFGDAGGRWVVWRERAGVKGFDLVTRKAFDIPLQWPAEGKPRISRDRVLWAERRDYTGYDIVGCDLATKQNFVVTRAKGDQGNFEFDGDVVVWVDPDESDDANIYAKDLATGEQFTVSEEPGQQGTPDVAGDWIVYTDYVNWDIKAFNLRTKERKTVCSSRGRQYYPRISETGFVVWQDEGIRGSDEMDIRGRHLSGGDIVTLASGEGAQHSPSVDGYLLCYRDTRYPGGYGLVGLDLLSGTRFGVASARGDYVSDTPLDDGCVAWFATAYDVDPYQTRIYIARPTDLDVIPETPVDLTVEESEDSFPDGADTVVLATSASWQDAGVGAAVAGRSTPLLLTSGASLPTAVSKELDRLDPSKVVIVGPASSITPTVAAQIGSLLPSATVERVSGAGATATSLAGLQRVASRGGWDGTVLICSPGSYTSAIIAAPVSSRKGYPLVYAGSSGLSREDLDLIRRAGAKRFVIVGGGVPSAVEAALRRRFGYSSTRRIVGANSAETSVKFANWAVASAGMRWNRMGLASSANWTRGIAAATAKGRDGGVVLLTNGTRLSSATAAALKAREASIRRTDFIGSASIVSKDVRRQVRLIVR